MNKEQTYCQESEQDNILGQDWGCWASFWPFAFRYEAATRAYSNGASPSGLNTLSRGQLGSETVIPSRLCFR